MAEQEPSQIKSDILMRVRGLYLVFILVVVIVLMRLCYVQFLAPETRHNAKRLSTRIFLPDTVYAQRGSILSRDGEPLASSIFRYQPHFDFASEGFADEETFLTQSDSLAKLLSAYFGDRSAAEYRRLLRSKRDSARRYRLGKEYDTTYYREDEGVLLLLLDLMTGRAKVTERVRDTLRNHRPTKILPRDVDYGEWEVLRKYPILNYNMGVTYALSEYDRRIYPQGDLARRLIGRTGTAGNYGLELLYDEQLRGEHGFSVRQRIARGFSTRVAGAEHRDAVDGMHVVTTIDLNLQDVADRALRAQLEKQNATWGTTLVMESRTGEILAMANLGRSADGRLTERENYALGYSMEPGSTFKLATVLTLLDDAGMSPDRVYETHDGNPVKVGPAENIRDSHRGDHEIALKRAVAGSSNVYFAKAVWEYYGQTGKKQQFSDHLHRVLGLGETTGLDSLGERKPSVTTAWKVPDPGIMLVKMSYGYRVQMTPMQMLTFYNAVANGGKKIAPVLVKELRRGDRTVTEFKTHTLREKICSDQTLAIVRDCLEEVAKTGTAVAFFSDTTRLRVGAKTGTAQITSGEAGHYLGSMVAYFPAENPRYTVLTTIRTKQQAGKAYYGASLAGPVVKRVVDYLFARDEQWASELDSDRARHRPEQFKGGAINQLREVADRLAADVRFDERRGWGSATVDSLAAVDIKSLKAERGVMPDVRRMGLKDALFLLEQCGLRVTVEGSGAVREQSIAPGQPIRGGEAVLIRLRR